MDVILINAGTVEQRLELLRELEQLSSMQMETALPDDDFLDLEDYEYYDGHYDWWDLFEEN